MIILIVTLAFFAHIYLAIIFYNLKSREDFFFPKNGISFRFIKAINYARERVTTERTKKQLALFKKVYYVDMSLWLFAALLVITNIVLININ